MVWIVFVAFLFFKQEGGLAAWNAQYKAHRDNPALPKPNGNALKKQLNAIKKGEFPWMYEVTALYGF